MADLNNKITLLVGADMSQAERALRSAPNTLGQHGRTAGDVWGRNFHQSSGRWLNLIGNVLTKFGGDFGRSIAEGLHIAERAGKALGATERGAIREAEGGLIRTAAGTAIGQEAGGAIRQAIATGAGAAAGGAGAVAFRERKLATTKQIVDRFLASRAIAATSDPDI